MVAFVSGDGLGLGNTSLDLLGAKGSFGNSSLGRAGDDVFVNVATGNLVVQRQDDFLSVLGQDVSVFRTYNSQGLADGDNNDGWRLGLVKGVSSHTGTVNVAGSTITRTDGDGATSLYGWDTALSAYICTNGTGACDALRFTPASGNAPACWTWTDGATQQTETYDWIPYTYADGWRTVGKIISTADADGNKVAYEYQDYSPATRNLPAYANNFLLKSVTASSGDKVEFAWTAGKLQSVTTTAGGVARQAVSYTYDANNRLLAVNVAAAASGQWSDPVNVTTFEYNADGTILAITGDDGSRTAFSYLAGKVTGVSQSVDGAMRAVNLAYSALQTTISDADGSTVVTFDAAASQNRLKSVKLPAGELFRYSWDSSGNLTRVTDARNLSTTYGYDSRGNQLWSMDAAGNTFQRTWSAKNELLSESVYLVPDADALGTPTAGTPLTTQYAYDVESHLRFVVTQQHRVTEYRYDTAGHVVQSRAYARPVVLAANPDIAAVATALVTTAQDRVHRTVYDTAGRAAYEIDTLGAVTQYTYDVSSGLLLKIEDRSVADIAQVTQYAYDLGGRHLREKTATVSTATNIETDVAQDNHIAYDQLGRQVRVQDGRYDVAWTFDAVGNRLSQRSRYSTRMTDGTDRSVDQSTWNKFDAMNRETVVDGVSVLVNGVQTTTIGGDATNSQGQQISYDGAGNRIHVTQWGKGLVGNGSGTFTASSANIRTSETSFYDAAGRLKTMYREGAIADARRYDAAGHVVEAGQLGLDNVKASDLESMGLSAQTQLSAYDGAGQLVQQAVMGQKWRTSGARPEATVGYGYDALGRVAIYDTSMHLAGYARHYDYKYTDRDSHSVASIEVHEVVRGVDDDHPVVQPGVLAKTQNTYDANGYLRHVEGSDLKDTRDILSDAQGRVLRKTQYARQAAGGFDTSIVARETNTLIVNGQEVGSSSDDKAVKDTFNKDYVQTGSFTGNTFYAVQAGDTLQGIAQAFWGDSNLWYLIADANGRSTVAAGQVVLIPARPTAATDNMSILKPYDPSKGVGDLRPTSPMPQGHHGGCGGFGQVLTMVVAVVATVFTAGAAALAMGAVQGATLAGASMGTVMSAGASVMAGGAVVGGVAAAELGVAGAMGVAVAGGAAGSIAGQGVAIAAGIQDSFSWKSVALSALGAGVTAGIGELGVAANVARATGNATLGIAAQAALANVATQGVGVATGVQHSFNWKAVAAAAVGAGVGAELKPGFQAAFGGSPLGNFGAALGLGLFAGGAAALARGGRVTARQVATDAFGNALGSSLAEGAGQGSSAAQQGDPLGDFINEKLNDQDRRDRYGLATGVDPFGLRVGGGFGVRTTSTAIAGWSASIDAGIQSAASKSEVEFIPELHADGSKPVYDFGDPFAGGGDVLAANGAAANMRPGNTTTMGGPSLQLGERFSNWFQARGFKTNADADTYDSFMRTGKELFGDKFIQQAIRAGDLPGGPGDLVIGLVGGGKGGQQAIRAADDAAYLVERTFIGGAREVGALREFEVGTYKELDSVRRNFGAAGAYDIDHVPSKAALRIAREDELGRTLTSAEVRQIENEGIGVAIERDMHRDSRTYAGRNNALKIDDATNLHQAIHNDLTVFIDNAATRGISEYQIMKTVAAVLMKNRLAGVMK